MAFVMTLCAVIVGAVGLVNHLPYWLLLPLFAIYCIPAYLGFRVQNKLMAWLNLLIFIVVTFVVVFYWAESGAIL